jgi:hypothetical protein
MKKCLHLKKTKPHWRRKPPKVVTWKERREAEHRHAVAATAARRSTIMAMVAMSGLISSTEALRMLHDVTPVTPWDVEMELLGAPKKDASE